MNPGISRSDQIPMRMVRRDYEVYHYLTPFEPVELHFHDFYEIFMLVSGSIDYLIDGWEYAVLPGDILLIAPGELHRPLRLKGTGTYERIDIYIRPERLVSGNEHGVNLMDFFAKRPEARGNLLRPDAETGDAIRRALEQLRGQMGGEAFGAALLEEAYFTELLVFLNRAAIEGALGGEESRAISVVDRVVDYINGNLSEDLSLEALSARFFISKYHLIRAFKRRMGFTPHQFVRYKRLLTARMLLRAGMAVLDACHASGFSDYSNFARAFREEFGVAPRDSSSGTAGGLNVSFTVKKL